MQTVRRRGKNAAGRGEQGQGDNAHRFLGVIAAVTEAQKSGAEIWPLRKTRLMAEGVKGDRTT
jgi:hypothetical protein